MCAIFLPASHRLRARPAGPKITLHFPRLLVYIYIYLCIRTYHVHNNYVMYIVAMRPYYTLADFGKAALCSYCE